MKSKSILVMIVVVLVSMCTAAFGTTYYVGPNGDDDANGLTLSTAWKTAVHAVTEINAGDHIYFREGKYLTSKSADDSNTVTIGAHSYARFPTDANENTRITLQSYPGERAIISCMIEADWWVPADPCDSDPNIPADPNRPIYYTDLTPQQVSNVHVSRIPNCSENGVPLKLMTDKLVNGRPEDLTGSGQWARNVLPILEFTSGGTTEIKAGYTIIGATSGATGNVDRIVVDSGSWAGGDATGTIFVASQSGNFQSENLDVNDGTRILNNLATVNGDSNDAEAWKLYVWSMDGNSPETHTTEFSEFVYASRHTIELQLEKDYNDTNCQSYITFEDLIIEGGFYPVAICTDHIELKNCTIRNCQGDGIKVGGKTTGSPSDPNYWNSEYGLIEDCNIYHFGESGIDITGGDYWVVRGNKIHDSVVVQTVRKPYTNGIISKNNSIETLIERNEIYDLDEPSSGITIGGDGVQPAAVDFKVTNNIIYGVPGPYVILFMAAHSCDFSNNTVYDCNLTEAIISMRSQNVSDPSRNNKNCVIKNNIFYDNEVDCDGNNFAYYERDAGCMVNMQSNYNRVDPNKTYWWNGNVRTFTYWQDTLNYDKNSKTDTPTFVDLENNDFHLAPNSPCINAGDPNGDYEGQVDMDRQVRVQAGRIDIGSDEFSGIFNKDGVVDIVDFAIIAESWLQSSIEED